MQASYRSLSRLLHSSKRPSIFNSSSAPFNGHQTVISSLSLFSANRNFNIVEKTNHFRGFCSVGCSKRFILLGLVSLEEDNNRCNHHQYTSHHSKYFLGLFICEFILEMGITGFDCVLYLLLQIFLLGQSN